ncbi:MAG: cation diffusion facilitator family transporter [bacterium]
MHDHNHHHNNNEQFNYSKAFGIGISLNVLYVVIEFWYGFIINSMALISDAGHNLSDVLGLVIAWGAVYIAKSSSNSKRTYGLKKSTIFAALVNSIILLFALGAITYESILRLSAPKIIYGNTMIVVASIGVVINFVTALLFVSGKKNDLNIKSSFLHMIADAGVSFGVVVAAIIINITNWYILDPIISLVIVVLIAFGTFNLLKDSFNLLMDSVPVGVDLDGLKELILSNTNVTAVHDLHVWALSTTENALTVHVVVKDKIDTNLMIEKIFKDINNHYGIAHSTIQIEMLTESFDCNLKNKC